MRVFVLQRSRQGVTESSQSLVMKELVHHATDIPMYRPLTEWESAYYTDQVLGFVESKCLASNTVLTLLCCVTFPFTHQFPHL